MVQQIEINGKAVRVLFGMHFAEHFTSHLQDIASNGEEVEANDVNALIVWFGYLNYCKISKEPPAVTLTDVAIGVEMIYHNDDEKLLSDLLAIISAYNNSKFGKMVQKVTGELEDEAKKKIVPNGQTLDSSPLEF